jgi:hypothetical protein
MRKLLLAVVLMTALSGCGTERHTTVIATPGSTVIAPDGSKVVTPDD